MAIGEVFQSKPVSYIDERTGYRVIRPIQEDGNRHMYFTSNPFTGREGELLFSALRGEQENYYRLNFQTGEYQQLTDVCGIRIDRSYYDNASDVLYYGDPYHVFAVNVHTLEARTVYVSKEPLGSLAVSCDGRYLVTFAKTHMIHHGNDAGDVFEIPLWRVFRINLQSGEETTILYRNQRIDHIQCSPTEPEWFMYCVWGYHCTHQRIWRAHLSGQDGGPIGNEKPNEHRTHEYYTSDGRHVAFHGKLFSYGSEPVFIKTGNTWGICDADGGNERIYRCEPKGKQAGHSIISHNGNMIVCDGDDCINEVILDDGTRTCTFRPLAVHASSMSGNFVHPHPSFSHDDRYVVFATDRGGEDRGNIYLIDLASKTM